MGIQQNIKNIAKLGFWLDIVVDHEGDITAGVYLKPNDSGMTISYLDPVNEKGNDIDDVLERLMKRINKQLKMDGES